MAREADAKKEKERKKAIDNYCNPFFSFFLSPTEQHMEKNWGRRVAVAKKERNASKTCASAERGEMDNNNKTHTHTRYYKSREGASAKVDHIVNNR